MRYGFLNPINLIKIIRYRFFLFAGIIPFFLGQAVAFGLNGSIKWSCFWLGFAGIFLVLAAVELFNEYFDAKEGGDRIFSQQEVQIPSYFYGLGISALCLAFFVGLYFAYESGWPILVFCFLGFIGAYFYVGPPIRWAYRGFGEIVIGLCYGPFMLLGSYYIQTQKIDFGPFFVSLICGLSMFCLAVLNEIPDYYQDTLIGKRNLVVRLGKQRALILLKSGLAAVFMLLALGVALRIIPLLAIFAMGLIPWLFKGIKFAEKNYEDPKAFRFAVNTLVVSQVVIFLSLCISFLKGQLAR